ncbi:hypothetical protein [Cupriavidus sp. AcVe19-1a]|uniref:hypothetical protein n=1 Tax=Cupriavidus sp. AcVe19-1a TaxID=2821359 RepID=UPI001AE5C60B|nr:hypothetical protein [Cupriavidus sp. AcVe19-1a]MBP0632920.1 hypothetical protein [Cupriavidus sp. AcVe19-1a]
MPDLDYPERPKASPCGGFLTRSRGGQSGNFEVVIPWPDGGLAHFWRDNDDPAKTWHGPTIFGRGRYQGASVIESDFRTFDARLGNLEVVAVAENGDAEHWWRENGGTFRWSQAPTVVAGASQGVPALAYSGARFKGSGFFFDLDAHGPSEFFVVIPSKGGGFNMFRRRNDERPNLFGSGSTLPNGWEQISSPPVFSSISSAILRDRDFVGLGLALTTLKNITTFAGWKAMREGVEFDIVSGDILVCGGSSEGALSILEWSYTRNRPGEVSGQLWIDATSLTLPTPLGHELRPFRGRPAIIQADYGLDEIGEIGGFFGDDAEYGNLEVVAPAKAGGLLHFWRDNGDHGDTPILDNGWSFGTKFGEAIYDEVSMIQSRFGTGENGNLEVIARRHNQRGFDFFWREDSDRVWRGPIAVVGEILGTVQQPLIVEDILHALAGVGVKFSVPEADLRDWLANPEFTPYPSISSVLLETLAGHKLKRDIDLDVVVFNYEHSPGEPSPRKIEEVDVSVLKAAILESYNSRYGTNEADLSRIALPLRL